MRILEVKNLKKHFFPGGGEVLKAVDGVSFHIDKGETLGLVGESGCGKTTTGRTILNLHEITEGRVIFDGIDVGASRRGVRRELKKRMQIIFQDPYASLNPRMTVGDIIAEGIDIHRMYRGIKRQERVRELLDLVGLNREHAGRFPHEFSGGQRQRIGIARALAIEPEFIVCDEPISALDVSIQAQIVNLLIKLQKELGLTYLFIAHDLSMVRHISDRVGVMYLGRLVEVAESEELYEKPNHPYTQVLLGSIPVPDPKTAREHENIEITGEIPSSLCPPSGCPFRTRCRYAMEICSVQNPPLKEVTKGHYSACHLNDKK